MTKYESFVARGKATWGRKFSQASIAKKFVPAYNYGQRIRVRFHGSDKMVLSGTVGVTTGWKPAFLLMQTKRAIGSPWTLSNRDRIVPSTTPIKRY
jgi:hypothetical protein